jgi:hypothetical protein
MFHFSLTHCLCKYDSWQISLFWLLRIGNNDMHAKAFSVFLVKDSNMPKLYHALLCYTYCLKIIYQLPYWSKKNKRKLRTILLGLSTICSGTQKMGKGIHDTSVWLVQAQDLLLVVVAPHWLCAFHLYLGHTLVLGIVLNVKQTKLIKVFLPDSGSKNVVPMPCPGDG